LTNSSDEINLFELFNILRKYKTSIFLILIFSIILGLIFNFSFKQPYEVRIKTFYNYHPVSSFHECQFNQICMDKKTDQFIISSLGFEWKINNQLLTSDSFQPLSEKEYFNLFANLNEKYMNQVSKEAYQYLDYINSQNLNESLQFNPTDIYLYSKKIIDEIDLGTPPIIFHSLEIKRKFSAILIIVFSILMGLFLGVTQSLFRNQFFNK